MKNVLENYYGIEHDDVDNKTFTNFKFIRCEHNYLFIFKLSKFFCEKE